MDVVIEAFERSMFIANHAIVVGKPTTWRTNPYRKSTSPVEDEGTKVERLDALIATKYEVEETKSFVRGVGGDEGETLEVMQEVEHEHLFSEMSLAKEEAEIEQGDDNELPQEEEFLVAEYVHTLPILQ